MQVTISPTPIGGSLTAPASKSAMQRACAAALLRGGTTVLHNPGVSNDDEAALDIIQQLGAVVKKENDTVTIQSTGVRAISPEIHCGESGLSARMFTSIAALSKTPLNVTGSGSLIKRPFSFFTEVLPQLGVACTSNNGQLPLHIKGPLEPANLEIDGSLSSQFLTGLLFAFSAVPSNPVTITVRQLSSKPYIDLTLQVMQAFGLPAPENHQYESFTFSANKTILPGAGTTFHFAVEGDWSGAAFLLVAGAIAGNLVVKGLNIQSTQADKAILQVLEQCGVQLSITADSIQVCQGPLTPFRFNATDCPDLFPPLVALAAYCSGTSVIEGIHRLTHKESNRAQTLQEEFGKLGVSISFQDDCMLVKGGGPVRGGVVHSRHDHRIAMACAVAALGAESAVTIEEAGAVKKSYPQFWNDLQTLQNARLAANV